MFQGAFQSCRSSWNPGESQAGMIGAWHGISVLKTCQGNKEITIFTQNIPGLLESKFFFAMTINKLLPWLQSPNYFLCWTPTNRVVFEVWLSFAPLEDGDSWLMSHFLGDPISSIGFLKNKGSHKIPSPQLSKNQKTSPNTTWKFWTNPPWENNK